MDINVSKELAILGRMTVPQLREKYRDVFGDATRARHKEFLIKRIVWRMQALADGDLSARARCPGPRDLDNLTEREQSPAGWLVK